MTDPIAIFQLAAIAIVSVVVMWTFWITERETCDAISKSRDFWMDEAQHQRHLRLDLEKTIQEVMIRMRDHERETTN